MIEQDVPVNGIVLRCATWGEQDASRHPVLLVHGLTGSSRSWTAIGPLLAEHGFFVIAPDLRGRGHSSKPAHGYSVPIHADDLLSLTDALGLPRVRVVGHSLGAQISLYLAAMYPERVERLALIDAGGTFPPDSIQAIAASLARLETVHPSLDAYLEAMSRSPLHPWDPFWQQYYRYDALIRDDSTVTSRVPRSAIEEEVRALDAVNLDILPDRVRAPTLIVRAPVGMLGPDRGLLLPEAQAEWLHNAIPNSSVAVIPETNHYTILPDPDLGRAVLAFLRATPTAG